MNEAFYEQLVPQKASVKDFTPIALATLGTILLAFLLFPFIGPLTIFAVAAAIIAIWHFLLPGLKKEYEYYLLNYTMEISLILNKESRRNVIEFDIRKSEIVAPADSAKLAGFRPTKKMDFTSGDKNANIYCFIIHLEHDLCNIMIEPDEQMMEQMKMWLGPKMID